MKNKTLFKILGAILAAGGALLASVSTDMELEELVDKKFEKEKEERKRSRYE